MSIMWYKAWAELKAEAARAYLGILWWIIEPVLYMGAFYLVFAVGLRTAGEGFVAFLLCGLVPWKWFASTVQTGSNSIIANGPLISQVYFPKYIIVGSVVFANTFKFLMVVGLLIVFLAVSSSLSLGTVIMVVPTMIVQLVLICGCTAIAAALVPLLPDLRLLIENGLLVVFFMSGVFFAIEGQAVAVLGWNPLVGLFANYRAALIGTTEFDWSALSYAMSVGMGLLIVGVGLLIVLDRRFAKIVNG